MWTVLPASALTAHIATKAVLSSSFFMVLAPCSVLVRDHCSPGSFEGPQRYALDQITPHERQQHDDRYDSHDGRRGKQRDIDATLRLETGKPDAKRVGRLAGQAEREQELVPA